MNFWNKELPDELNQIAIIQRQPYLNQEQSENSRQNVAKMVHNTSPYGINNNNLAERADISITNTNNKAIGNDSNGYHDGQDMVNGSHLSGYKPSNRPFVSERRLSEGSEIVMGHMNKFGTRDNGAEDPVRTLKLLLQGSFGSETAENMYNAAPNAAGQYAFNQKNQMEEAPLLYYGTGINNRRGQTNEEDKSIAISSSPQMTEMAEAVSSDKSKVQSTTHGGNLQQLQHMINKVVVEKTTTFNNSVRHPHAQSEQRFDQHQHQQQQIFIGNNNYPNLNSRRYPVGAINYNSIESGDGVFTTSASVGGGLLREQDLITKSETTLHLLIGLIAIFIVLNIVIYSTYFLQRKKKAKVMQRKLGGILMYEGNNDDDLKRTKLSNNQYDGEDSSYVMDMVRCSNTYEAVGKTDKSPVNGFKISRQLSCSTMDTHTKVCEWIDGKILRPPALRGQTGGMHCFEHSGSKKSSCSFSSLGESGRGSGGGGSFGKQIAPHKVSVAVDATPQGRGSSVMQQEPIEVSKLKAEIARRGATMVGEIGRNIIICQDVEVDDQNMLTPQVSLDNGQYSLSRQHSTATETCETELSQPMHSHSRSDPINLVYGHDDYNEKTATFKTGVGCVIVPMAEDINVTSRDESDDRNGELSKPLTMEEQRYVLKKRKYPKVLPPLVNEIRCTDSPPMTMDLTTTYKRNSLPPNSFYYSSTMKQTPPAPPPRTVATLGRFVADSTKDSSRNSNFFTTSPLMLAYDYSEYDDVYEPEITQSTLIVGSLSTAINPNSKNQGQVSKMMKEKSEAEHHKPLEECGKSANEAEMDDEKLFGEILNQQYQKKVAENNLATTTNSETSKPKLISLCKTGKSGENNLQKQEQASFVQEGHEGKSTFSCKNNATPDTNEPISSLSSLATGQHNLHILYAQPKKKSHIPRIIANSSGVAGANAMRDSKVHGGINSDVEAGYAGAAMISGSQSRIPQLHLYRSSNGNVRNSGGAVGGECDENGIENDRPFKGSEEQNEVASSFNTIKRNDSGHQLQSHSRTSTSTSTSTSKASSCSFTETTASSPTPSGETASSSTISGDTVQTTLQQRKH